MSLISLFAFSLIVLLFSSTDAKARWATIDEADATAVTSDLYEVKANGTFTLIKDVYVTIKNEAGRKTYGTVDTRYNGMFSKVSVAAAETVNDRQKHKVSIKQIEDKPEKGSDAAFSKMKKLSISFPKVKVGSILHYKIIFDFHKTPLEKAFQLDLRYGLMAQLPPSSIRIQSKIPLHLIAEDPDQHLSIERQKTSAIDAIEIKLLKPVFFQVKNEEHSAWLKKDPYPRVTVSTTQDWKDIGRGYTQEYENEIQKSLPADFAQLADQAMKEHQTFVDRSNSFTSALADRIRYHSADESRETSFAPKPHTAIMRDAYGNCRDFATVTVAALRRMGYRAHVAFINSDMDLPKRMLLPGPSSFNHAIVRAEDEEGRVRWLDPTKTTSRAQAIRTHIAGRPALILAGEQSSLEMTPEMMPEQSLASAHSSMRYNPQDETMEIDVEARYEGFRAERYTAWELVESKQSIGEKILREMSSGATILESSMQAYDLRSRIVKDLTFKANYRAASHLPQSSAGAVYALEAAYDQLAKLNVKDRVSGYKLQHPSSSAYTRIILDADLIGQAPEPCSFDSPWMDGERQITASAGQIKIHQKFRVKAYVIEPEDLKSSIFSSLQKQLKSCLGRYMIVFQKRESEKKTALK